MELKIEKIGEISIIYLNGRLDINESASLELAINNLIDSGVKKIIFDLENLSYLSSSGLRVFISTFKKLKDKDGKMRLTKIPNTVYKILKMVEFDNIFDTKESIEDALKDM